MRTPIDIVMQNQAYYIEVHEGPSPFSTDAKDPWLTMAVVATITGARWRGHGELTGDEMQEIMNWCDEKSLVQRAKGRVVELRRRDKYTDFFVDNVQVKTISDFDVKSNPNWWHPIIRAIMSPSYLDYPIDIIEVDRLCGKRLRLSEV